MAELMPKVNEVVAAAEAVYVNEFGVKPDVRVYAPGRVNLIGEHTDYNEGFVMPMVSLNKSLLKDFIFEK